MKTSTILIALVVMVGVILAIFGYYYFKRQADWDEVRKAANTVDSGLRHETLIALRSKVADLDAALTHYVDGGGGRPKENRVLSIQQAIESVEWAIDHESSTSEILDAHTGFLVLRAAFVPDCGTGLRRINGEAVAQRCRREELDAALLSEPVLSSGSLPVRSEDWRTQ